jgi:hypothetical protein
MRKLLAAAVLSVALAVPGVASAMPNTPQRAKIHITSHTYKADALTVHGWGFKSYGPAICLYKVNHHSPNTICKWSTAGVLGHWTHNSYLTVTFKLKKGTYGAFAVTYYSPTSTHQYDSNMITFKVG